ncbi:MAG TPA: MoaD/ThiS family protein [Pirellulaceae bacterium]|nr:MoaD/ThiS family protein [Pirellulaceae bacterium]
MNVRVGYSAQLRTSIGRAEEDVELEAGSTLAALIEYLAARLDDAGKGHLVTPEGQIRASLLIVVNEAVTAADAAKSTILKSGDVVLLLPPIAGG